jgi:transcriptional regulator with XRE-family HTH domain
MGHARPRPKRLAAKLFLIRRRLRLSQPKLAKLLDIKEYTDISKYERDERDVNEPPLSVLLSYSRAANVRLEEIVDDGLDLEF